MNVLESLGCDIEQSEGMEGVRVTRKINKDKHAINTLLKGTGIRVDPSEVEKFDFSKRISRSKDFG